MPPWRAHETRSRCKWECRPRSPMKFSWNSSELRSRAPAGQQTVSKWHARFVEHRLDGLLDAPRPGAPRTIDDARVDAVIAKTLEGVPAGATRWSTRSMARESGLTQTAVSRIGRAFGLQPHRRETFKLSSDPLFIEKVRDIVALEPANGHAQEYSELRLRQARLLARLDDRRGDHCYLASLHFTHRLQQFGSNIAWPRRRQTRLWRGVYSSRTRRISLSFEPVRLSVLALACRPR